MNSEYDAFLLFESQEMMFTVGAVYPIWYNFVRLMKIIPERECVACLIINHTRKGAVCRRS